MSSLAERTAALLGEEWRHHLHEPARAARVRTYALHYAQAYLDDQADAQTALELLDAYVHARKSAGITLPDRRATLLRPRVLERRLADLRAQTAALELDERSGADADATDKLVRLRRDAYEVAAALEAATAERHARRLSAATDTLPTQLGRMSLAAPPSTHAAVSYPRPLASLASLPTSPPAPLSGSPGSVSRVAHRPHQAASTPRLSYGARPEWGAAPAAAESPAQTPPRAPSQGALGGSQIQHPSLPETATRPSLAQSTSRRRSWEQQRFNLGATPPTVAPHARMPTPVDTRASAATATAPPPSDRGRGAARATLVGAGAKVPTSDALLEALSDWQRQAKPLRAQAANLIATLPPRLRASSSYPTADDNGGLLPKVEPWLYADLLCDAPPESSASANLKVRIETGKPPPLELSLRLFDEAVPETARLLREMLTHSPRDARCDSLADGVVSFVMRPPPGKHSGVVQRALDAERTRFAHGAGELVLVNFEKGRFALCLGADAGERLSDATVAGRVVSGTSSLADLCESKQYAAAALQLCVDS